MAYYKPYYKRMISPNDVDTQLQAGSSSVTRPAPARWPSPLKHPISRTIRRVGAALRLTRKASHRLASRPRLENGGPILLADDDEDGILRIYEAFKKAGIRNPLFVVFDGENAIDYLAGRGRFAERRSYPLPLLVLLSTDLARTGGLEVLEWLRRAGKHFRAPPVILLTPSPHHQEMKKALQLGACDYVLKSFTLEEFFEWAKQLKHSCLACGNG